MMSGSYRSDPLDSLFDHKILVELRQRMSA